MLLGAAPLSLVAQIRRPDPVPTGAQSGVKAPKRRTEIFKGGGFVKLNEANATKGSMIIASSGFHHQMATDWLYLGGTLDVGRTTVDGKFFPYEKRSLGDSSQFVRVDGHATMVAARFNTEALFPLDDDEKFRAGVTLNAGAYAMLPSPAGGAGAGPFVAPTFGGGFVGEADITARFGLTASLGFTQFMSFDREKLRPSDPALADPVFITPLVAPPKAVKSFGGARVVISMSYRLGVKTVKKGGAK